MNTALYHALSILGRSGPATDALCALLLDGGNIPARHDMAAADITAMQVVDSLRRDPSIGAREAMRSLRAAAAAARAAQ